MQGCLSGVIQPLMEKPNRHPGMTGVYLVRTV
jgi:hypothetical protein